MWKVSSPLWPRERNFLSLCVDSRLLIADNLAEAGEFSIDLYTMPDLLTTKLWEHLVSRASEDGKDSRHIIQQMY